MSNYLPRATEPEMAKPGFSPSSIFVQHNVSPDAATLNAIHGSAYCLISYYNYANRRMPVSRITTTYHIHILFCAGVL